MSGVEFSVAYEVPLLAGEWHVVMAVRDFSKAELVAKRNRFPKESYSILHCDLASLTSVRQFVDNFRYCISFVFI